MAVISFFDLRESEQLFFSKELKNHTLHFSAEPVSINLLPKNTEVLSVFVSSQVTSDIITALPKLKLITCRSTGFDNIDIQTARKHNVAVCNVPRYGDQTVAEYTFTLILALSRQLAKSRITTGNISSLEELTGFDLHNKTIGIIGTGRIGQRVARIAKGFGMKILAYDVYPNLHKAKEIGFTYTDFLSVLQQSDVVSLHAPLTPDTHHMLNQDTLGHLQKHCILVNTSRGELIDTRALLEYLEKGKIFAAGLDVFEEENYLLHPDSHHGAYSLKEVHARLLQLANVIMTPHTAFNTYEAIDRINKMTVENIVQFIKGTPLNLV